MSRMSQRLALFNLLINDCKVSSQILCVLLIERCHSKFLMGQSLLFSARWSAAIVSVVSEVNILVVCLLCLRIVSLYLNIP